MVSGRISLKRLLKSEEYPHDELHKTLKDNRYQNGTEIAIIKAPVMNRLLGNIRPAQRADPRKSNRQRSGPQKGETGGESLK
jgi:hypothetical protein